MPVSASRRCRCRSSTRKKCRPLAFPKAADRQIVAAKVFDSGVWDGAKPEIEFVVNDATSVRKSTAAIVL
jgi:hypothetical protein